MLELQHYATTFSSDYVNNIKKKHKQLSVKHLYVFIRSAFYTVSQKKKYTKLMTITLLSLNGFPKFLQCCKEK